MPWAADQARAEQRPYAFSFALGLHALIVAAALVWHPSALPLPAPIQPIDIEFLFQSPATEAVQEPARPAAPESAPAPSDTVSREVPNAGAPLQGPAPSPSSVVKAPSTQTPASALSILGDENGLWALSCQGLDADLFDREITCPEPGDWLTGRAPRQANAGLIDPAAEMRAVLGPAFRGMSLEEIHRAFEGVPFFLAPSLDALPGGAPEIGHGTAADSVRDRLPPVHPDPNFGD